MALEDCRDDLEWCSRCSSCKFVPLEVMSGYDFATVCPSIARYNFHSYSAGGRLNMALSMLEGRIGYTDKLLEMIYQCLTCGGCDVSCKYNRDMEPLEALYQFRIRCVEDGQLLPSHMVVIDGLRKEDNMMGRPRSERGDWAEGLGAKDLTTEKAEVYFHAGCNYCFDKELWPAARSALDLLIRAGVDVGIMGKEETCCGGRSYEMGYEGELTKFAEHNMEMLKATGVKTLVTPCSDCYHTFKVLYHKIGKKLDLEVLHITEFIERLIKEGKIEFTRQVPMTVTYHDPCHLGRMGEPWIPWTGVRTKGSGQFALHEPPKEFRRGTHGIYEPPREILKSIPGLRLVEMERIRERAWCCGAGGGVIDAFPDFAMWTALERIREAKTTGAGAIVTACPWCKKNFSDAIKESGDSLRVYDIIELVEQAI
ncbi:MAG: (Fe-S)-binding protein [Dehalococcoidales bacterium]|nr:(Fe-S)-binding protein [Dehalococcoidales bacterium]